MDYTALDLCLGENGLDCVFEIRGDRPRRKTEHPAHHGFSGR